MKFSFVVIYFIASISAIGNAVELYTGSFDKAVTGWIISALLFSSHCLKELCEQIKNT